MNSTANYHIITERRSQNIINAIKEISIFELSQKNLTVEKLNYTKKFKSLYVTKDEQHVRDIRGVAIGGKSESGAMVPLLQVSNETRFTSFSFKHQRYCFLWVFKNYMDQKFHDFYRVFLPLLDNLSWFFIFCKHIREIDHLTLNLLKRPDT